MLLCVCSVIDHRRSQNVVRTSVTHLPKGLGGVLPYLAYKGMCGWTGYGFFGLAVLNREYNFTCLCPKQGLNLS